MMNKGRGSDLADRTKRFALEETQYWFELLGEAGIFTDSAHLHALMKEANELTAIMVSSVRTAKQGRAVKK